MRRPPLAGNCIPVRSTQCARRVLRKGGSAAKRESHSDGGKRCRSRDDDVDLSRRKFLTTATVATGAVGAAFVAVPFVSSWSPPSAHARSARPPSSTSRSSSPGQMTDRHLAQAADLRRAAHAGDGGYAGEGHDARSRTRIRRNPSSRSTRRTKPRSRNPECWCSSATARTWAACRSSASRPASAELGADWPGGFFCPCHGSRFDLAGRVFNGSPASVNLRIPPYAFANDQHARHRRR